jgi:transposase
MSNFKEYNQKQGMFMPFIPDELLEETHSAKIINVIVEKLNLNLMIDYYSKEGQASYHPRMMTKVLFYGYQQGIFSGRKLEKSLQVRADFIYLSGGQVPDFRTLNLFRIRHKEALVDIFAQIVILCDKLGMIDFKNLTVDGQNIRANANFRKSYNKNRLKKTLEKTKTGIEKLLSKEINDDFTEEIKNKRLLKLNKKQKELDELQKELELILDENTNLNQTDKDAKILKHKDRTSSPSYNHQSAVDDSYGVTAAVQTRQKSDCSDDLFSILEKAEENTGKKHENVLADSGFSDYEALEKMEKEHQQNFFVPDKHLESSERDNKDKNKFNAEKFKLSADGNYHCPAGKIMYEKRKNCFADGHFTTVYECRECENCSLKNRCTSAKFRTIHIDSRQKYRNIMRKKLKTDKGREIYMKRQHVAEAGHGNDQKNMGWRQHYLRGLSKASLEFMLLRIGSNISKIIKYKADKVLAMASI